MGIDPRNFATPPAAPAATPRNLSPRHNKKRLILSQSMVIDIDPAKVCLSFLSPHSKFYKFPFTAQRPG
jgi:hypothetical protein